MVLARFTSVNFSSSLACFVSWFSSCIIFSEIEMKAVDLVFFIFFSSSKWCYLGLIFEKCFFPMAISSVYGSKSVILSSPEELVLIFLIPPLIWGPGAFVVELWCLGVDVASAWGAVGGIVFLWACTDVCYLERGAFAVGGELLSPTKSLLNKLAGNYE